MGEFAKQTQLDNEYLTRAREEVKRLEFCLEGLCAEQNSWVAKNEYEHHLCTYQEYMENKSSKV